MSFHSKTRREFLRDGTISAGAAVAWLSNPDLLFPDQTDQEELVPFLNMPRARPGMLDWETLDSWLTPQEQVFTVSHYPVPPIDERTHEIEIAGLVKNPRTLTMEELKAQPHDDQFMTLECSGNGHNKGFMAAIYNSRWTGTRLWPLLEECEILPEATEIVFFGIDRKVETLRRGSRLELKVEVPFGRSMSVADARKKNLLLAWNRNGEPIARRNGAPLRLIVPGWYGVTNVKWLKRIELRDRRYMGRYMGRDYVTVRGERQGNEVVFVESSVTRMNLKSIVARVTRLPSQNGMIPTKAYGATWSDGTEVDAVEVKVDNGPWVKARLDEEPRAQFSWRFFSIDLGLLAPGPHVVISRAIDVNGKIQPSASDDEIALKRTYWEANQQWPREIDLET